MDPLQWIRGLKTWLQRLGSLKTFIWFNGHWASHSDLAQTKMHCCFLVSILELFRFETPPPPRAHLPCPIWVSLFGVCAHFAGFKKKPSGNSTPPYTETNQFAGFPSPHLELAPCPSGPNGMGARFAKLVSGWKPG